MTLSKEQLEWIVAEVVRRLRITGVAGDARSSSPVPELRLADRVVTMRTIDSRLAGIKRVVVQPRAVVTPAVRDELKARKVELVFDK